MSTTRRPYIVDCVNASSGKELEVRVMARSRDEAMQLASGDGILASSAYEADPASAATPTAPPVPAGTDPATLQELKRMRQLAEKSERRKGFSVVRVFLLFILILIIVIALSGFFAGGGSHR